MLAADITLRRAILTESNGSTDQALPRRPLTIETLLIPLLTRPRIAQVIKYTVYFSLVVNFGLYVIYDYQAYRSALPANAPLTDIVQQFSTSIDMAAWIGLVFLFELETYALPDEAFDGWIPKALHSARVICYISIGFAAYGYTVESLENFDVAAVAGVSNICELADKGTHLQTDVINYQEITSENCSDLSPDSEFYRIANEVSVIDASSLKHVQWLGWIDIDNAFVWIIVVLLIEFEVWLQATDRFSSRMLTTTRQAKTFFYLVLIANGFIWTWTHYWLYAWDAFLWIFGFWAIELNLAEWERDRLKELKAAHAARRQ